MIDEFVRRPEAVSVIPRTPATGRSDGIAIIDPMADIASIVADALAAGLDPRRLYFASLHMRFAERGPWERAASEAQPLWDVAAYSTGQGHMLRLSRRTHPTARDLAALRSDALVFATANAADWLSMSIEDLQQAPTPWQTLTVDDEVRLPDQRDPSAIEAESREVPWMQRGGTA